MFSRQTVLLKRSLMPRWNGQSSWMIYYERNGKPYGPLHGLPVSLKVRFLASIWG
jgi:hypothetical protein